MKTTLIKKSVIRKTYPIEYLRFQYAYIPLKNKEPIGYTTIRRNVSYKVTSYLYKLECGHYKTHKTLVKNLRCDICNK